MSSYETIHEQKAVRVKIPMQHPTFMTSVPKHDFQNDRGDTIEVEPHWRSGLLIQGTTVIVNRHFYGICPDELGKHIVADIQVVRKTTKDGRDFLMLDIRKCQERTKSLTELKFVDGNGEEGIPVPRTRVKIVFRPRPVTPVEEPTA
ncbi:MAG: hypothetical protein FJZ04_02640 [Candidatus Moranbacteria bacterium]|nr:hypothetical protein [Candidatus Moranbacteria bacterium]